MKKRKKKVKTPIRVPVAKPGKAHKSKKDYVRKDNRVFIRESDIDLVYSNGEGELK
jgi:hypothetical protein